MKEIFTKLINKILDIGLEKLLKPVYTVFYYLLICKQDKIEKEKKQERIEEEKKIDDVCDNGTLDDLLNLKK